MNLYLDRIPGLCNVNVVPASSLEAVVRKGHLVHHYYGVYILEPDDVVFTKPSNGDAYMTNVCTAEGCIDNRWKLVDISSKVLQTIPSMQNSAEEINSLLQIHCIAKSSVIDDILTTTVLEDTEYNVEDAYHELIAAHRSNGTLSELI